MSRPFVTRKRSAINGILRMVRLRCAEGVMSFLAQVLSSYQFTTNCRVRVYSERGIELSDEFRSLLNKALLELNWCRTPSLEKSSRNTFRIFVMPGFNRDPRVLVTVGALLMGESPASLIDHPHRLSMAVATAKVMIRMARRGWTFCRFPNSDCSAVVARSAERLLNKGKGDLP